MAQKVNVVLEDDLDGGPATQTVSFALDGQAYEIDLSNKNAAALRRSLERYIAVARKARRSVRGPARRAANDYDPKAVRAWAASNKIDVPARGRIPSAVIEQYRSAGN